ncbi:MAG: hypothetical protein AMJ92_12605 [candidate division Zixibacteria bacterium SM23_81]|nr:MAG: hypothetical protein AMJ92_12605 [candidate division Zixibacteria bacterium SM23_81]
MKFEGHPLQWDGGLFSVTVQAQKPVDFKGRISYYVVSNIEFCEKIREIALIFLLFFSGGGYDRLQTVQVLLADLFDLGLHLCGQDNLP